MRRRIAVLAIVLGIVGLTAFAASATQPDGHLVTICHATPPDTAAQGWHSITVDVASVGYQHSGHQSEHDADIIPPYEYGDVSYAGKNWDATGQAVWENGCELPDTTTTSTVPDGTTTTTGPPEVTTTTNPPTTTTEPGVTPGDPEPPTIVQVPPSAPRLSEPTPGQLPHTL